MSTREFRFAEVFSYERLVHAMAGAVVRSVTVFFPLDTARLRLQGKASVVNVLMTTPLWVVNTRLKLQGAKFRNADLRPTNYSGIMGKGSCSMSLLSLEVFLIGAIAKAVATTVTYPLQTVQSILRFGQHTQHTGGSPLVNSLRSEMHLLINRVRKYGMLGLFKGLEAKLLQTVLTAALTFLLYEKIASSTFRVMGLKRPASSH
uniref:Peroxisomal membrane protein PMP34 n=1 Tax=Oncorhynchus mykiss TaxID=8022 RepID=A0A8C7TPA8_ONCMY